MSINDIRREEMMLKLRKLLLPLGLVVLTMACSPLTSDYPLSTPAIPADADKFTGAWLLGEDVVNLRFGASGVALLAGVEWQDSAFKLAESRAIVTNGQYGNYISLQLNGDSSAVTYNLFAYRFVADDLLVIWQADAQQFAAAIGNGQLQGEVREGEHSRHVYLHSPTDELFAFVDAPERGVLLFTTAEPLILRRISNP
jgi:hypothetical protein